VDHKTIQAWCSLLETGFIIFFLRPWFVNFSKRIVKTPKVYFYDTGVASNLLGIRSADEIKKHWARGALFENMIIADTVKNLSHSADQAGLYFWRDNKGVEIGLLIAGALETKVIEIKSGSTINPAFFANIEKFEGYADRPLSKFIWWRPATTYPWDNHLTVA
jgi:predicted AAA+ superfamily ATPase